MNLLNKTKYPLLGVKMYNHRGKKVNIKPFCEWCAFADIDGDDNLVCSKTKSPVPDDGTCIEWNITVELVDDFYMGCHN